MATQVDPYATTNAFWKAANQLGAQRQQGIDNQRNRLRDMYLGEQQQWAREDRATRQQATAANADMAERERVSALLVKEYAPLARNAIASGKPQQHMQALLQNPAIRQKFKQDGIFDPDLIDVNAPDFVEGLQAIAGFGGSEKAAPKVITQEGPMGSQIVTYGDTMRVLERPQPAASTQKRVRTLSKDEVAAAGLQPGGVYQQDETTGAITVVSKPDTRSGGGGGLPVGALRLVDEAKQAINSSKESLGLVDRAINTIASGKVNLGLLSNAVARGRNLAGVSSESSRAFTDVKQTLEKLRNNYLLLAKGVQTEGDATRAWNSEIGENVQNDNQLATQQLTKAKGLIERMVQMQQDRIDTVYANYGSQPPQGGVAVTAPAVSGSTKRVRVDANGDVIP